MQNAKPRITAPLFAALAMGAALAAHPASARAVDPAWTVAAEYTADVSGVVSGGASRAGRYLDNLSVELDGDLEQAVGWRGARLHVSGLYNGGGEPNALAGTLQGVDISRLPSRARVCSRPGSNRIWAAQPRCWRVCMISTANSTPPRRPAC